MNTYEKILKVLKRRKHGLTSYEIMKKIKSVPYKTIQNRLYELYETGCVDFGESKKFNYLTNRYNKTYVIGEIV